MQGIDPRDLRNAFGTFATGVTIVTSAYDGQDTGLTANSFSSVSLDPPLILWSLDRKSGSLPIFEQADHFAVHVLSAGQEDLSNRFAGKGEDRFTGLEVERGGSDIPLLKDCAARFECRKAYIYEGGDHVIIVGEVVDYHHSTQPPLLFHSGKYKRAHSPQNDSENSISIMTAIARINMMIRKEAIEMALGKGLAWPDITALGVIIRSGPIAATEIDERIAPAGLLFDEAVRARLLAAGFVTETGGHFAATDEGRHFATEATAASRAREMELQMQTGRTAQQLDEIMSSLAIACGVDKDRPDPVIEMGDAG